MGKRVEYVSVFNHYFCSYDNPIYDVCFIVTLSNLGTIALVFLKLI